MPELSRQSEHCGGLAKEAGRLASANWSVFPVWPRRKEPKTRHGVKDATSDIAQVQAWWRRWPDANIGLAVPQGFVVLDVDSDDALHQVEDRGLPETVRARTANGHHFWFRISNPVRNRVGLLAGVDTRAAGGYVIAPPSIHPSGATYRWEVPLESSAIADAPRWLEELLVEPQAQRRAQGDRQGADWLATVTQPVPQGRRNQTLAEVAGLLFRYLPNAEIAAQLAYSWARDRMVPPLPEAEIKRTLDSIAGRELRRRQERA